MSDSSHRRRGRAPLALVLALMMAPACSTLHAPTAAPDAALVATLDGRPAPAPYERRRARVLVDSSDLRTEASGVAVVATDGPPRLALQLLPAVGGKVLDLVVGQEPGGVARLEATWPQAGRTLSVALDGGAARGLELFLAASLLEAAAPLTAARIRGARRVADGWEVALEPRLPGLAVVATLDGAGVIVARRYRYRGVEWREHIEPGARSLTGRGVTVRVEDEVLEPLDAAPARLFRVDGDGR